MRKILIIKTGYSETADADISNYSSLGDVLRTTVILHKFKYDNVTWLTDERAIPLLKYNSFISRLLIWDIVTYSQLSSEFFDIVINLEKIPGLCALADKIFSRKRCKLYGFGFDAVTGKAVPNDNAEYVFGITADINVKRSHDKCWQELLYSIIDEKWNGEEYILGYEPNSKFLYSIGLNNQVGNKWPSKIWNKWYDLSLDLSASNIHFSWQPKQTNLYDYIDWINNCYCIVTCDSLGLHIALALKKKVVVLFGPTHAGEIYLYDRGEVIEPSMVAPCMPCLSPICKVPTISCMESITINQVFEAIKRIIL